MELNPILLFVAIILVLVGVFIYQALPNSPWYPGIEIWVWLAFLIIAIVALFGAYISGTAM